MPGEEPYLRFGPSGVPHSAPKRSSEAGIERVRELGLGCMEIAWVHQVRIKQESAARLGEVAVASDVALSVHAPYYINLNSKEPDKVEGGRQRILAAARAAGWCGARNVALHLAFYHDDPPEEVYVLVRDHLAELTAILREEGCPTVLRPEVMGKHSQFGTLEEILSLSAELDSVQPCLDFAHLHARLLGVCNTYEEFCWILERIEAVLGRSALDDMHIHVSGIEYGRRGEVKHLPFEKSDFDYRGFVRALKDFDVKGLVVVESPIQEDDALLLQGAYLAL